MRHQRGIGLIGIVLAIGLVGFFGIIGLKLVPVYMEYMAIKRALVSAAQAPESKNASVNDLRRNLERRFEIDNVKSINSADVEITKEAGMPVMSASYASRVSLFANVSVCIDFDAKSNP